MIQQPSYSYEDIIAHGNGELPKQDISRLPLPPMLMFDRITEITGDGGEHGKDKIVAEL
ncbi:MAG: hypothetical protein JKX81_15565, partial [Arenicella sp.]|nr:hypothetical protein [Arenicella sp.]